MNWFSKFFIFAKKHKIISGIIILALIGGGYYWYQSANNSTGKVSYVTSPVVKGTIVTSVSGSGQVSTSDQVDLKSKVSENVVYVGVVNGQRVGAGTLLMEFDTADAEKSVRDAQISLESSQLSLQKLVGPDNSTVPLNKQQAQDALSQDYNNGFNDVSNAFLDLPSVMTGLQDVLFGNELSKSTENIDYYTNNAEVYDASVTQYRQIAYDSYQKALAEFNNNFNDYKSVSRTSDTKSIDSIISETYKTSQDVSDAIKNANNLIQFYENIFTEHSFTINSIANTQIASLNNYTGQVNTHLSDLLNIQSTITNDTQAVSDADLTVQSQNLSLQQAQNALSDAKDNLANCYIYAPFDGIIAAVDYKKGDAASSGGTAVTLITNQSITEIPFNEVDVTKIKIGQKAVLTFDAIDGLTIAGQVADIDTLGTVTQGVVNYNAKIAFDASGTQIKSGMSVTANVITNVKQDVLVVPNSAIKTSGSTQYVQILVNNLPVRKVVQTGLANDTDTEITGGLQGGEDVITQTITTTAAAATASSASSALRIPGLTGGGGGFGGGGFGGGGTRTGTAAAGR